MANEIITIIFLLIGLLILYILLNKKLSSKNDDRALLKWLESMQNSLDLTNKNFNDALRQTNQNITTTLQDNTKAMNQRLDKAAEVIGSVGREVGQMAEIGRSMKELQEFLRSPKMRGSLGEQVLKDLLTQMFPRQSFSLQYAFKSGNTVDAALKTDNGIIPIDSKFPLENYKRFINAQNPGDKATIRREFIRDIKKHIDAISKKYILPDEGTIDYALMYIPSESIYYYIMSEAPELADYAHEKRVLAVSPTTFYAYLRTILISFEGNKIAREAKEILSALKAIQGDANKFNEVLGTLNRHVTNAYNSMSQVNGSFMVLGQKINSVERLTDSIDDVPKLTSES